MNADSRPQSATRRKRVVVVGAGFGGLRIARALRDTTVDVLIVDRHNFHTFLPLLYEVAAAGLEPDDIARPVRAILQRSPNIRFLMAEVTGVNLAAKCLITDAGEIPYDYLVLSPGSATNFFGITSVEQYALGLKDIHQATAVRNSVLRSFERAVITTDPAERDRLMTIVIIGGGPTGVELAGALAELKRHVLPRDYPDLDLTRARVILLEATDRVLAAMPESLQRKATKQLRQLGVEVSLNTPVREVTPRGVVLASGDTIDSDSVIWVAGVRGEPLGETTGVELGPQRRVKVLPTLQIPGHPEAYVIGDLASLDGPDGRPYPMVAPVAIQQAELVARNILRHVEGAPLATFKYKDAGQLATIGRRMAVAHVFGLKFSGFIAWALWLVVHLIQLIGFRNRVLVLLNWTWNYFQYDRANRLVTDRIVAPNVDDAVGAPADIPPAGIRDE